jgi:plastocyanin
LPTTTSLLPTTTKTTPPTMTTSAPTTTASHPPTTTTAPPVPTTSTSTNQVRIVGNAFNPNSITVSVGTTVTWVNLDGADHTVTCTNGPSTFDRPIAGGATISITFSIPGTYNYICTIHPYMNGVVIVK